MSLNENKTECNGPQLLLCIVYKSKNPNNIINWIVIYPIRYPICY